MDVTLGGKTLAGNGDQLGISDEATFGLTLDTDFFNIFRLELEASKGFLIAGAQE